MCADGRPKRTSKRWCRLTGTMSCSRRKAVCAQSICGGRKQQHLILQIQCPRSILLSTGAHASLDVQLSQSVNVAAGQRISDDHSSRNTRPCSPTESETNAYSCYSGADSLAWILPESPIQRYSPREAACSRGYSNSISLARASGQAATQSVAGCSSHCAICLEMLLMLYRVRLLGQ